MMLLDSTLVERTQCVYQFWAILFYKSHLRLSCLLSVNDQGANRVNLTNYICHLLINKLAPCHFQKKLANRNKSIIQATVK